MSEGVLGGQRRQYTASGLVRGSNFCWFVDSLPMNRLSTSQLDLSTRHYGR